MSLRFKGFDNSTDPDRFYLNASIVSNDLVRTDVDPYAEYHEQRTTKVLSDTSEYNLALVNASLVGMFDLPLFLPTIDTSQSDVNLTTYSFTMSGVFGATGGTSATLGSTNQQFISWTAEDSSQQTPRKPNSLGYTDLSSDYYFAYSYTHVLNLMNTALQTCYDELSSQYIVWTGTLGATQSGLRSTCPKITRDITGLLYLNTDTWGFGATRASASEALSENITLYMNDHMYSLLSAFPCTWLGNNVSNGKYYQMILSEELYNYEEALQFGTTSYSPKHILRKTREEYHSSMTWTPVESIVFISHTLPIVSEALSKPLNFGESNVSAFKDSQNLYSQTLADIKIDLNAGAHKVRRHWAYNPDTPKLISIENSKHVLDSLDIKVMWKNKFTGKLTRVRMPVGSCVNIKLMFIKRHLN